MTKVLAIIPARAGSKRLPGKNLMPFAGQPLIARTIEVSRSCKSIGRTVVSTDSPDIAAASREAGADVPGLRPAELATDGADTMSVVRDVLGRCAAETVVLLQPTSPLRALEDIQGSLDLHLETGRPVVSVCATKPFVYRLSEAEALDPVSLTNLVVPNGAVYVANAANLRDGGSFYDNAIAYRMPASRSIDIDTHEDFMMALALAALPASRDV